jgi:hypothetical protein
MSTLLHNKFSEPYFIIDKHNFLYLRLAYEQCLLSVLFSKYLKNGILSLHLKHLYILMKTASLLDDFKGWHAHAASNFLNGPKMTISLHKEKETEKRRKQIHFLGLIDQIWDLFKPDPNRAPILWPLICYNINTFFETVPNLTLSFIICCLIW